MSIYERQVAFLKAAQRGDVDTAAKILYAAGPDEDAAIVNCRDEDGYSPLHRAAYNGRINMLKFLLDQCALCLLTQI